MTNNIFNPPKELSPSSESEIFEEILNKKGVKIERIVSNGQTTPDGEWYDQKTDEWVILLQGKAILEYDDKTQVELNKGDYVFIPAHQKHKVIFTSASPPCIWVAVHF